MKLLTKAIKITVESVIMPFHFRLTVRIEIADANSMTIKILINAYTDNRFDSNSAV